MPAGPVHAVRDVTLQVRAGDHIAVRGPSGCGKSTLLHMLGCVDAPSSGTLLFDGQDVSRLSDARRSALRLRRIGFIFQRFFLLPMLTAAENVELPLSEAGASRRDRQQRTKSNCSSTSASPPAPTIGPHSSPAARCSASRSHAHSPTHPQLLLADEPTGELDEATGAQIAALLDRVNADGTALVIVTHDSTLADRATRVLMMRDGRIERETTR